MSGIKIIGDKVKSATPKHVPKNAELSTKVDRYRNTGKPPLQISKSFSPQGKKGK